MQLIFSPLAPSICQQLKKQNIYFVADEIKHYQKMADAILLLSIHGIITNSAKEKGFNKIYNAIKNYLQNNHKTKK